MVKDGTYNRATGILGDIILAYLGQLQEHSPDILESIIAVYNNTIKARSIDDDVFFERVCNIIRVSTSDGLLPIKEYLKRSDGVLYYFSERGTATQHKLLFARKGIPVIDASWGMEEEFLEKYSQKYGVRLERLESGSGIIFKPLESMDEKWSDLERQFKLQLQKEAKAVAFEPNSVPAVLMAQPIDRDDKDMAKLQAFEQQMGLSGQVQRMFQQMARKKAARVSGEDTVLHLNTTNPLMQRLRDMNRTETFRLALTAIYNNAAMFAHHYVSPENAEIIFATNNNAISEMIGNALALGEARTLNGKLEFELQELKRKLPQVKTTEHRTCFFAFDYTLDENYALMEHLQQYFSKPSLSVEVIAPAKGLQDLNILKSMYDQLYSVHFGLAEITGNNPNVFYEAGLLRGLGKPVVLLKKQGTEAKVPFDVFSDYRIEYQIAKRGGQIKFVWLEDELDKVMKAIFAMVPGLEHSVKWKHATQSSGVV